MKISLSFALLGLFAGVSAGAADANPSTDQNASCYQETQHITIWPTGPKSAMLPRFEERAVTVCNGKIVSQTQSAQRHAKGQK